MRREAQRLDGRFDLLVVGGGIYGAWIAYDAALRGLSVALVERDDWGSGTSSASSKLIHGGLRYLEHGDGGLVAKALRERGRLMRLGPHRVRERRFLLPLWSDGRWRRAPLLAGLMAYDRLAGAAPAVRAHRAYAAEELLELAPFLRRERLSGGYAYSDGAEDDARLVLELVAGALDAGAVAVHRAKAESLLRAGGRVQGALVHDRIADRRVEVRGAVTIDATAAWASATSGLTLPARHTKGVHLALPPLPIERAFLLLSPRDGRVFFLIPWYGSTLVGTTDTDFTGDPDRCAVDPADVDYLLGSVAAACPGLGWAAGDVRASFAGLRTLRGAAGAASSVSREWELLAPQPGLLLPLGGKLTSARVEAAHTVDRVCTLLGRTLARSPTAHRSFPWAPRAPWPTWCRDALRRALAAGVDAGAAAALVQRHGVRVDAVLTLVRARPDLARRIVPAQPFIRAEAVHAARAEQALSLRDVLRRRIPLAILERLDAATVADVAALVGSGLGWDVQRTAHETATIG